MKSEVSVVILAAGLGTRMRSKTAKVLHRAGGLTLVEHVVRMALRQAAPEDVTVVMGHQAAAVQHTLQPYSVQFAVQTEQRGTGHAVASWAKGSALQAGLTVILYGDSPLLTDETLAGLLAAQRRNSPGATVITTNVPDPTGYGRIVRSADGSVHAIVEQKAATAEQHAIREINSGIYCFRTDLLRTALDQLQPNPASGEYYLTDVVPLLQKQGHRMLPLELLDPAEVLGINTRVELAAADAILRERKLRALMLSGVTIEKPETVTVDVDVEAGQDTIIGAGTHLLGATRIGADCRVGPGCVLDGAILDDGVILAPYTVIQDSVIGAGASIGPFARLRMKNTVGAGAHIGNFVELKKTNFGAGAKAGHLAYLGDAQIGEAVNVGAGTITCNYDGQNKHVTTVGAGSFLGSNSTLVAPLEIGEEAYIGAGSVITDYVPDGALALGRERQVVKPDWAKKRRARKLV